MDQTPPPYYIVSVENQKIYGLKIVFRQFRANTFFSIQNEKNLAVLGECQKAHWGGSVSSPWGGLAARREGVTLAACVGVGRWQPMGGISSLQGGKAPPVWQTWSFVKGMPHLSFPS